MVVVVDFFPISVFFQFESSEFPYVHKHYLQEHNVYLFTLAFHTLHSAIKEKACSAESL